MTAITRQFVRIDSNDPQLSTLNAVAQVLQVSGLDNGAQCHVLRYLLDSKLRPAVATPASTPAVSAPAVSAPAVVGVAS